MLTPTNDDPNKEVELERRKHNPQSFSRGPEPAYVNSGSDNFTPSLDYEKVKENKPKKGKFSKFMEVINPFHKAKESQ